MVGFVGPFSSALDTLSRLVLHSFGISVGVRVASCCWVFFFSKGGGVGETHSSWSLLLHIYLLVSSPDPYSQQLRVDYITATWKVGLGNKNDALVPSVLQCLCPKIVRQSKFRTNLAQLERNKRYHFHYACYLSLLLAVLLRRTGCALLSRFQAGYYRTSL